MSKDKNYWLNKWKGMMCSMMYESEKEFFDSNIHCGLQMGLLTCSECRYYIEDDD